MSKKFYAVNDKNEYWKPSHAYREQKLAMFSDGTLIVLSDMIKEGWKISLLPKEFFYQLCS